MKRLNYQNWLQIEKAEPFLAKKKLELKFFRNREAKNDEIKKNEFEKSKRAA